MRKQIWCIIAGRAWPDVLRLQGGNAVAAGLGRAAIAAVALLAACMAGCGTTTPRTDAGGALSEEASLLNTQAQTITGQLAAPEPVEDENRPLVPRDVITIKAWLSDMATMLPGYPAEAEVPASGPVFLPHFGLVELIGRRPKELQEELKEKFNASVSGAAEPMPAAQDSGVITPGENLTLHLWLRDNISTAPGFPFTTQVADNGAMFVPHLGMLPAAGYTAEALQRQLAARFETLFPSAKVLVVRQRAAAAPAIGAYKVSFVSVTRKPTSMAQGSGQPSVEVGRFVIVLGRVTRPGLYPLRPGLRVREAIAMAGGLERYAHRNIFLVRGEGPSPEVVRINMNDIMTGRSLEKNLLLAANDAIYVAPKELWNVAEFVSLLLMPIVQLRDAVYLYDRFTD